jgi:hypothetical protein
MKNEKREMKNKKNGKSITENKVPITANEK